MPAHIAITATTPDTVSVSYSSTVQQPVVFGSLDETIPRSCSPVDPRTQKIKLRSLLERRGSNTSLTLDLNIAESLDMKSPPSDSSTLEYLSSTGKRLTRRQLRSYGNNPKKLDQEFADIPLHYAAKLDIPGASYKNRYNSIWPNKETMVVLRNNGSPDGYINANYIRGRNGNPRTFVATQGPMPNTVDDFWALVWQERCPVIVMMTKLKEKNVVKCEPYFPNYEARYGDIRVFVHRKIMKNGYCVRDIELVVSSEYPGAVFYKSLKKFYKNFTSLTERAALFDGEHTKKGDTSHTLRHYWFTVWPDHKAPAATAALQLIEMIVEIETFRLEVENGPQQQCSGPTLVHCSAGLGRTGCYITVSEGMQELKEQNTVDVLAIVCRLRLDR
uniref:protein-tyrosine-phosphatase n=1 Tax=Romanomermis culicivorax TaxID=13658 RepID=A0A915HIB1_ROMCU